jgi:hypothetical protein
MANGSLRLCKECKFCLRLFDYELMSYSLFCENVSTKEMDHPIGFLSNNETGCEFFEEVQEESEDLPARRIPLTVSPVSA